MDNKKLREAIWTVMHAQTKEGIGLVSFPEEQYFIERTLIEKGILTGARKMCAHEAYNRLMRQLHLIPDKDIADKRTLGKAAKYIAETPYPWTATDSGCFDIDDNEADLPRWKQIYKVLVYELADEDEKAACANELQLRLTIMSSVQKNCTEKGLGTEKLH